MKGPSTIHWTSKPFLLHGSCGPAARMSLAVEFVESVMSSCTCRVFSWFGMFTPHGCNWVNLGEQRHGTSRRRVLFGFLWLLQGCWQAHATNFSIGYGAIWLTALLTCLSSCLSGGLPGTSGPASVGPVCLTTVSNGGAVSWPCTSASAWPRLVPLLKGHLMPLNGRWPAFVCHTSSKCAMPAVPCGLSTEAHLAATPNGNVTMSGGGLTLMSQLRQHKDV